MFKSKLAMGIIGAVALFGGVVKGAELGDKAKPLEISEWVKGSKVDVTDGKNIYVVEFWATWCPPCRKTAPYLTEIQKHYGKKGVKLVAITKEAPDKVRSFVDELGDEMDYTVAIDSNDLTNQNYTEAYSVSSVPHAFIIDRSGNVVWHGHPVDDMDVVLDEVIAGTYDAETFAKEKAERDAEEARMEKLKAMTQILDYVRNNLDDEKELITILKGRLMTLGHDMPDLIEALNEI